MDVHSVGHLLDSSMCSAWRVSFKLEVSARNTELSRHSIYSPTRSALSTASLRWFGVAWRVLPHSISGNFVAPLLLFSVVSHYTLLPRRSCWSPERGLLSDSAEPSLWLVRRLGMVYRLRCV